MIEVKNNWRWVKNHVHSMIAKDEQLRNNYFKFARKYQIKPIRIIEMYYDGMRYGMNNGQYLSFKDWFYRLLENQEY